MDRTALDSSAQPDPLGFFVGDSVMAARMRDFDWGSSPLGEPATWPQSLKTVVRIMLTSRYAMWMAWGPQLTFFCNDAYSPTLGVKQAWALGAPASRVWAEIWPAIGPLIDQVMDTGVASWNEDLLLFLERSGAPEETYHTFSYSSLADDAGACAGMFCVVTEETRRVIGQRRMDTLRELTADLNAISQESEVMQALVRNLGANPKDLPFTLTYLFDEHGRAHLASATGVEPARTVVLSSLDAGNALGWPIDALLAGGSATMVPLRAGDIGEVPRGAWDRPPTQVCITPIKTQGEQRPAGFFVAGLNPYRPFDTDYQAFLDLLASQIAAGIANARSHEASRQRMEALAQIDRAKTAFFSNVSHEFRTPLTLMLGPLEDALTDGALPAPEADRLRLVYRNGTRLLKLVNSLLDFSRIEAGRMQAGFIPVDLARMTAELASNFRSATEKAGLRLAVNCHPLAQPVYVDPDMWEMIVLNLVSNAFKFTFEGGIEVTLRPDGHSVQLLVRDTGIGIPAHELPRMFERFHRIDGARGRSFEGSGIGLALVQELVRLHGGTISLASEEGRGTTFTVSLPFGTAHLPAAQVRSATDPDGAIPQSARGVSYVEEALSWLSHEPALAPAPVSVDLQTGGSAAAPTGKPRAYILVADDNADMRAYVQRLLGTEHDCVVVADGLEALESMRQRRPDLLLTDVMMPRLDGFGLIRCVRDEDGLRDLPVIALSARAGEEARIEGLARGADDYLVKPFSSRELLARVDGALAIARIRGQVTEALRESEERFRAMADHAPVMVWTTDIDGQCTYLSRSWYEFTGQTPETGLGTGWLDATHPEDRPGAERSFVEANATRSAFSLEYRLRRHDGSYRWAIDAAAPWLSPDGAFLGYVGSVIDITERKAAEEARRVLNEELEQRVAEALASRDEAEAQLRHAQKLEAVGRLTGGVAHDFNNLLQVIGGNLQLLGRDLSGHGRAEERVKNALGAVGRGAKLASQLLAFGRRQPLAPKVVNLGRLIRNMDDMLRRALGEGIEVETIIGGGLWNTHIDAGQMENALLNLAINARDAMQRHGRLTIEAGNSFLDDGYAERHDNITPGQYVMVAVSDTGCGIPAEQLERVFEPFFTTKREGEGTGLGLSMVYGFVKQSGGHIKLYSEPDHGTTVRLYLPRSRGQEDVLSDVDSGAVISGTETVLVVEDDENVRATVVEMLSELGYRVLKAKDADSGLVIIESGMPIDVLFTDVVMPGQLRSPELARKARQRLPNIAVLFTSGYTDNAIVHGGRLDEGIELLSKPYTREALARKIRHVLGTRVPAQEAAVPTVSPPPAQAHAPDAQANGAERAQARHGAGGQLRVLLVEDDELIRFTSEEMLTYLGYVVHVAADGEQALGLLATTEIDVLVTDVNLPGMSGRELAALVRSRQPGLPVLFASGTDHGLSDLKNHATGFIPKPYGEEELRRALAAFGL
ncbi:response regulator [Aquabacterium soli]|uniref:histidine kinase n=1 Tax=Aquabacterium soli TaxID=2493092 RepID=A0A3R8YNY1_9BURK|nr:response regulator [Aquabacterium soli]RRS04708.1 response regulator [Aquabacterium soli]